MLPCEPEYNPASPLGGEEGGKKGWVLEIEAEDWPLAELISKHAVFRALCEYWFWIKIIWGPLVKTNYQAQWYSVHTIMPTEGKLREVRMGFPGGQCIWAVMRGEGWTQRKREEGGGDGGRRFTTFSIRTMTAVM